MIFIKELIMTISNSIGLNRIIQPELPVTDFIRFTSDCGFTDIELRNDLQDPRITGSETIADVKQACTKYGITVRTVNALKRFNDPSLFKQNREELISLTDIAQKLGCSDIVLCPVNDPADTRSAGQQFQDTLDALQYYAQIFEKKEMTGLVEPLGFGISSLRFKQKAVEIIRASGVASHYRIVHDTFHHYLAGESRVFPEWTGIVHVSGVTVSMDKGEIIDDHRVLVDDNDIMNNKAQLGLLLEAGYTGPISYEPFSPSVQHSSRTDLKQSLSISRKILFGL
jgi:2-keto-myo-inositol isomerase